MNLIHFFGITCIFILSGLCFYELSSPFRKIMKGLDRKIEIEKKINSKDSIKYC